AVALHNTPPALAEKLEHALVRPGPHVPLGRAVATKTTAHIADMMHERCYIERDPMAVMGVELGGSRTVLSVPMLKADFMVGAIAAYRQDVRPFSDKQIALVQSFASQAVIAIENSRLLNELRARTPDLARSVEELRALGDVSQAVNSTLDLATVLS